MTATVTIMKGTYRGQDVSGVYTLVKPWKDGARGGFVTILDEHGVLGDAGSAIRVRCELGDIDVQGTVEMTEVAPKNEVLEYVETDDETMARIEKTFGFIPTLTAAAQKGQITALIITGPAGVGKSYGAEEQLKKMNMTRVLAGKPENYTMITGGCSAIGLYKTLYNFRRKGSVIVFDDCDGLLWIEDTLNMLKGALDTKAKRTISWLTESRVLAEEDIPNSFEFEGSVVFLTNQKFDRVRSNKLAAHLSAIMSRAHYLDLSLDTRREQILRIRQVVRAGMLDKHDLSNDVKTEVVDFVIDNQDYLTELSLRTVIKAADLAQSHPDSWQDIAEYTLLSHKGRIQKSLAAREEA